MALAAVLLAVSLGFTTTACAGDKTTKTTPAVQNAPAIQPSETATGSGSALRGRPHLSRVANFKSPVEIKSAPGFRNLMFVVEREGRIMVIRRGKKLKRPFLNIKKRVNLAGERGLLSVAFPPNYRKSIA